MDINISFESAVVDALNRIADTLEKGFEQLVMALPNNAADQAVIDAQVAKLRQITADITTIIPDATERM